MSTCNDIVVYIHDGKLYQEPHYILKSQGEDWIKEWKTSCFEKAKEINADHFVYATKTYNAIHDYLKRVDLYAVPLSNDEFEKRIKLNNEIAMKQCESVWYGVWHKGTAY